MESIAHIEQERARIVASEYKNQGYKVILNPSQDQLPDFLQKFRPDIIARKNDETIVIEVKSRRSFSQNPQLREMACLLQNREGWKFELVLVGIGDEVLYEEAEPFSEKDVKQGLEQAQKLLDSGFYEASLLYAWSAVEAFLRLLAGGEEIELKNSLPPYLIKTLVTEGIISRDDYQLLMDALKSRNAIAHGYKSTKLDPSLVRKLIDTTSQMLESQS